MGWLTHSVEGGQGAVAASLDETSRDTNSLPR